jgi:hypothetical protein
MAANCLGYSLKHGLEYSIPNASTHPFHNPVYVTHLHKHIDRTLPNTIIKEKHFHYEEIEFREEWRNYNILLDGYFQSYRYFEGYDKQIVELFNYPYHLEKDVCSIHARFGDYLTIPGKHILVDADYLNEAMTLIKEKTGITRFKVFSDDLPYFKNNFGHLYNFEYSTNNSIEEDLIEISCCHSNIGSSSTFSIWGAELNRNPNKIVITQKLWFKSGWQDSYGVVDTSDILRPEWIKL